MLAESPSEDLSKGIIPGQKYYAVYGFRHGYHAVQRGPNGHEHMGRGSGSGPKDHYDLEMKNGEETSVVSYDGDEVVLNFKGQQTSIPVNAFLENFALSTRTGKGNLERMGIPRAMEIFESQGKAKTRQEDIQLEVERASLKVVREALMAGGAGNQLKAEPRTVKILERQFLTLSQAEREGIDSQMLHARLTEPRTIQALSRMKAPRLYGVHNGVLVIGSEEDAMETSEDPRAKARGLGLDLLTGEEANALKARLDVHTHIHYVNAHENLDWGYLSKTGLERPFYQDNRRTDFRRKNEIFIFRLPLNK